MQQWPTTLGVVVLTALFVVQHVRNRGTVVAATQPCPRCRAQVPSVGAHCPACNAPLHAFSVVTAPIAAPAAAGTDGGVLHAIVRADQCAGCGTCVDACPEPGALTIVNKIALVNLAACKGHADCVAACPVGAIFVTAGEAVQTVEVPDLNEHFESRDVPGLYVVRELGGRGLIKNAINEGKLAMENVAASLAADRTPVEGGVLDVVVVGSGPAGLSAGLEALARQLRYAVLEQGTLADTIARYPRHKVLFAEPLRVPLYGDLWVSDASKESLVQVWQTIITRTGLQVRTGCRVESVKYEHGHFVVRAGEQVFRARRVVLALGRRGNPRKLGVPGEELGHVFYDIVEMEAFAGRNVLVVGGGDSAVESALGLANQDGTKVTLSYRGKEFGRVKDRNRAKIDAAVKSGQVRLMLESETKVIRAGQTVLTTTAGEVTVPADDVIVRVGGEAPYPFIERCGVRIVKKSLAVESSGSERKTG